MVDNPFTRLRVALRNEALRNLEQDRYDSELESACRALVTSKEFKIAELASEICGAQCTVPESELAAVNSELEAAQDRCSNLEGALQYILEEFRNGLRENKGGQHVPDHSPWANARRLPSLAAAMRRCVSWYGKLVGVELE